MKTIATITCPREAIEALCKLSASVKQIVQNPIIVSLSGQEEFEQAELKEIEPPPKKGSFAVRMSQLYENRLGLKSVEVERELGAKIWKKYHLKVNLKQPENTFQVFSWDNTLLMGWLYASFDFKRIAEKSPKESPFFGGGAMKPMLSKILVNLLYPHDPVILDAFCGHGGILREIASLGSYAIGFEISNKIARECKINNEYHRLDNIAILISDATKPPIRKKGIRQIVSDPPYAIQTTTKGKDRTELLRIWLQQLDQGTKAVITVPKDMAGFIGESWRVELEVEDYVHRSLIRVARRIVKVNECQEQK